MKETFCNFNLKLEVLIQIYSALMFYFVFANMIISILSAA